jgi:cyclase
VQSIGYQRYLPLGHPEVVVENLDRWGVDEILLQCIDRSREELGPDFDLLGRVGSLGFSTPLIYGGGIADAADAVRAVSLGADRVLVDSMLRDNPDRLEHISRELGTQAVIAQMPVRASDRELLWLNYRDRREVVLDRDSIERANLEWASEVMLTDWQHEGVPGGFDASILSLFPADDKPLLAFGGLSDPETIRDVLSLPNVVAVGIGNFLNYREHTVQKVRQDIRSASIRAAHYAEEEYSL